MNVEQQFTLAGLEVVALNRRKQLARWVSNIFSPPVFGLVGLMLIGQMQPSVSGWLWVLFYIGVAIGGPLLYIVWLLQTKQITDFHIKLREQRLRPMLVMIVSSVLAWAVMHFRAAPIFLQTLAILGAVLIAILLIITLRWKISGHATAVSAFAVFTLGMGGALALPLLLLVPLVIWARLTLKRHSFGQTIAGALLGSLFVILVQYSVALQCGGVYLCG